MERNKRARLSAISDERGVIAAVAMDQRGSLRRMIAEPEARLAEFKTAVTEELTPYASAVLLDPEYGMEAAARRAPGCGLLLTYEADGFENPRPHRMPALLPRVSALRLRELGADAVKLLLSWAPDDDACANDDKRAWTERIGWECAALEMPFFLEPVVYDPAGAELGRRRPELVVRTMEEFSKPQYQVDVLKVQFPVTAASVGALHSRAEALDWFRAADAAAGRPYIYLSAGVEIGDFVASLELAAEAGARFSGVLCGRALWQDGIPAYASGGAAALRAWLRSEGVENARRIRECLKAAKGWQEVFPC